MLASMAEREQTSTLSACKGSANRVKYKINQHLFLFSRCSLPSCVPLVASVTLRDAERERSSEVVKIERNRKFISQKIVSKKDAKQCSVAVLQLKNSVCESQKITLYLYIYLYIYKYSSILGCGNSFSRTATLQQ